MGHCSLIATHVTIPLIFLFIRTPIFLHYNDLQQSVIVSDNIVQCTKSAPHKKSYWRQLNWCEFTSELQLCSILIYMYYQEIERIFSIDTLFFPFYGIFETSFLVISKLNKCIKVIYLQKNIKVNYFYFTRVFIYS